jgi:hypothetical protein
MAPVGLSFEGAQSLEGVKAEVLIDVDLRPQPQRMRIQ